ncbi:hypothetical protein LTSEMIS_1159, partial [Salmonella enterica subsp. enterica serovar Mississippi str. A4-633]
MQTPGFEKGDKDKRSQRQTKRRYTRRRQEEITI